VKEIPQLAQPERRNSFHTEPNIDLCEAKSTPEDEEQLHQLLSQAKAREEALVHRQHQLSQENLELKQGLETTLEELEACKERDAASADITAALRAELAFKDQELQTVTEVDESNRDGAMREFFEMACFAIKLKYGPFSDEKLAVTDTQQLYEQAVAEKIPMWDWTLWVEIALKKKIEVVEAPIVHVHRKISRVCNWDGQQGSAGTLAVSSPPKPYAHPAPTDTSVTSFGNHTQGQIGSTTDVLQELNRAAGDSGGGSLL